MTKKKSIYILPSLISFCLFKNQLGILYWRGFCIMVTIFSTSSSLSSPARLWRSMSAWNFKLKCQHRVWVFFYTYVIWLLFNYISPGQKWNLHLKGLSSKPSGKMKYVPNLCFKVRDFKFWLLAYFWICFDCAKFQQDWTTFIFEIF